MSARRTFVGCSSLAVLAFGGIALVAILNPMAFGFFSVMFAGIAAGGWSDAQFKPQDAIVQKYETRCLPNPGLVSEFQPKCTVGGKDGAMLKTVTLNFETGRGNRESEFITYPRSWGTPPVASHVTIFVNQRDPTKFKLEPKGWISPGY